MEKLRSQSIHSKANQVWVNIGLPARSAIDKNSSVHGVLQRRSNQVERTEGSCGRAVEKGYPGRSDRCELPGLLRETVFSAKARGQVESDNRPIRTEQIHQTGFIRNGDSSVSTELHEERSVRNINRSDRCLFPCTGSHCLQEIYESGPLRQSFTVQGHANGSVSVGQDIPQGSHGNHENHSPTEHNNTCIFRRLVAESSVSNPVVETYQVCLKPVSRTRLGSELEKVRVDSNTGDKVCWSTVRPEGGSSQSSRRASSSTGIHDTFHLAAAGGDSENMAQSSGQDGLHGEPDQVGRSAQETIPKMVTAELVSEDRVLGEMGSPELADQGGFELVAESLKYRSRCLINPIPGRDDSAHGCQQSGLRSNSGRSGSARNMVKRGENTDNECQRNPGGAQGCDTLSEQASREESIGVLRQLNHSGLAEQARRNQELEMHGSGLGDLVYTGPAGVHSESQACARKTECSGRRKQQKQSGNLHGMVNPSRNTGETVESLGQTTHRHVRNKKESQAANICISGSGSSGLGSGCNVPVLEESIPVCLPSMEVDRSSANEDTGRGSGGNNDSPSVGRQVVVPPSTRVVSEQTSTNTKMEKSAKTTTHGSVLPRSRSTASSCMEIVRKAKIRKGFSKEAAEMMTKDVRASSQNVYKGKWKGFTEWLKSKDVTDPTKATMPLVADFLVYKFNEGAGVSTILGYRTAINRVLSQKGLKVSEDKDISALISHFALERPVNSNLYPKWDLKIVLDALRKQPYEPLISASLYHVTRKTVFLLILASGVRRGEIHALDVNNIWDTNQGKEMLLTPNPKFMAKAFKPLTGVGAFEGFKVPRLKDLLGPNLEEENKLCPVRALKMYLNKTRSRRGSIRNLWITCNKKGPVKAASKNTISSWVKKTVSDAYFMAPEDSSSILHRSCHEIRAQAASLALYQNVALETILKQCRWASQTTFTTFYLRDMSGQRDDDMHRILPLMAAGSVSTSERR